MIDETQDPPPPPTDNPPPPPPDPGTDASTLALPPPPPPPAGPEVPDNGPLAVGEGKNYSTVRPGTKGAIPFHTSTFMNSRFMGAPSGPMRAGVGSPLDATGLGGDNPSGLQDNDMVRHILAGLFSNQR